MLMSVSQLKSDQACFAKKRDLNKKMILGDIKTVNMIL